MSTPDGWHLHRPRYAATPEAAALDSDLAQAAALLRAKDEHIRALEVSLMGLTAEVAALREALAFWAIPTLLVFAEDNSGARETVGRLRAALSQPFDHAAHQKAAAREWLTEERLLEALKKHQPPRDPYRSYENMWRAEVAAILTALFEEA